jgi:hypothetical protein
MEDPMMFSLSVGIDTPDLFYSSLYTADTHPAVSDVIVLVRLERKR